MVAYLKIFSILKRDEGERRVEVQEICSSSSSAKGYTVDRRFDTWFCEVWGPRKLWGQVEWSFKWGAIAEGSFRVVYTLERRGYEVSEGGRGMREVSDVKLFLKRLHADSG